MIYFIIPVIHSLNPSQVTIYLDRSPQASSELSLHEMSSPSGASQTAPNGINIRSETVQFNKKNIPIESLDLIDKYFDYLGTNNLTIYFPEGSKNYYLNSWTTIIDSAIYGSLSFSAELMYL